MSLTVTRDHLSRIILYEVILIKGREVDLQTAYIIGKCMYKYCLYNRYAHLCSCKYLSSC